MSCCRLASYFETDILSRNTHPLPTSHPPHPLSAPPLSAGARHTLRPDEHPRTTKTATVEATTSHRCTRQPQTLALCAPRGSEEK